MRLPRDAWQLSLLLPIAVRSRSAAPSVVERGIVHRPSGGRLGWGESRGARGHAVAGLTEGHATSCPFWRFGEIYAEAL